MFKFLFLLLFTTTIYSDVIKINLITTNDIHGKISRQQANFMNPKYPPTILGGAAFSKYVDDIRNESKINNEGILLLDGGNFFQGNSLGMADDGKTMIQWMNRLQYDALVPGVYDFISGAENLNYLSTISTFPFLSSNLECNNCPLTSSNIIPYIIKNIKGINIGIIGIVNSKLSELTLKENINGIIAKNEMLKLNILISEIKNKGVDVIIILTSSGVPWDREKEYNKFIAKVKKKEINEFSSLNALEMAYFVNDVDFIVSGGNSKGYWLPWYDPNSHVYVMQGYGNGSEFSHIKLIIDKDSHLFMGYETVIDGKASQTLLADDFQINNEDQKWINEKVIDAKNKYKNKPLNKYKKSLKINKINNNSWDIPNINKDNSLEIITWNCEFFPHANDSTILALSEAVQDLNADIIGFQEIRRVGWFSKLMSYLPNYNYIVSKQTSFMDLALIYKSDLFTLVKQYEPFADDDYNFAGRPPLQADLIYHHKKQNIPMSIINLHMKCCDSGLERRKKASQMLHDYLNKNYNKQPNIIVLGDWNDDTKDKLGQHCFEPFFQNERFYFTTANISFDINQASYPKEPYVSFLDHIMVSTNLIPKQSNYFVKTLPMGSYMGSFDIYEAYISDHLPVLLSFSVTN